METLETLKRLEEVISDRKDGEIEKSYVARLFAKGQRKIAQKVGEEAVELAIAATSGSPKEIIDESADLLFHLMVLLAEKGLSLNDVASALADREGLSGLEEKARRTDTAPPMRAG